MTVRRMRKQTRKRRQHGGTRKMKIRNFPSSIPIFDIGRKNLPTLLPHKPYNYLRGKVVNVFGENKHSGNVFININGEGISVAPENIEWIDPEPAGEPCVSCKKVASKTRERNLLEGETVNVNNTTPYVNQNNFWAGPSSKHAYTTGLATCTALQVEVAGIRFLAHVSSTTDMRRMTFVLRQLLKATKGQTPTVSLWTGTGVSADDSFHLTSPSAKATAKIMEMLKELELDKDIKEYPVCYAAIVPTKNDG